jgi:hypothetical protein
VRTPSVAWRDPIAVDGRYRLNTLAGVGVDVACFDALATTG